ncbi:MAG: small subunit ribosomal protein S17 [archaeon GW2011_AR9]|nr:small subunit ribosomal protein S17 [uncultured archaeon]KHO50232.1 MAG: small subunit ribosomal protein S17 [archaeon GW2011_AR9]MBS3120270.1 30S ribosomal protein S17 [Candidatus Woesearchaeota archaeon]HIG92967.1 30S ribosomal protein S17 [Candidatus Woesearchaeota archaeon]HIH12700.1 30S ribosomal protein S17 [Candidatus Woesearchaeota archaeon]
MNTEILGIPAPGKVCSDIKCPFHGKILVKNELLTGKVIKKDINHSATIEWFTQYHLPKYERFETRRSRMRVHNPACINATVGAMVIVARTRPLSKTKNHVIIQVTGHVTALLQEDASLVKEKNTKPRKGKEK